jgi:recombinational DNA repair protein RecR
LLELGVESDIITESQVKQAMLSYVNTGPDIILVQDQISFDGKYVVLDGGTYKATDLVRVKNIENSDQEVAFSAKFIAFGE